MNMLNLQHDSIRASVQNLLKDAMKVKAIQVG